MATKLQIKRTSGFALPSSNPESGELVYIYDTGGSNSGQGQNGQRLVIGGYAGSSAQPLVVGGAYFTDMLDHGHGTVTADSAVIVDTQKKVNEWFVDNLAFDSATISTATSSNANLTLQPDGTGSTIIHGLQVDVSGTPTDIDEYIESVTNAQLVTNASHTGVTVTYDVDGDAALDISLVDLLSITGTASVGSSTAIPVLTYDTYGRITAVSTATISTSLTITDPDNTTNGTIALGTDDLEFEEGQGVAVAVSGTGGTLQVSITGTLATTSVVGVAKFNTNDFAVDGNGDVTIKTSGVSNTQLAGSISNDKLVNSKITIGNTDVNLGASITALTSLTEVGVDDINIDGAKIAVTTQGTDLDIETEGTGNADINLTPTGTGTVKVPTNYTSRTGFVADSLVPKSYVDAVAEGLHVHAAVMVATTQPLADESGDTVVYSNGTNGVGADLSLSTGITAIDGYTLVDGDRVMVKNEGDTNGLGASANGIYIATVSAGNCALLTRATDFDTSVEVAGGDFVFVQEGTVNGNGGFVQTETVSTIGSDSIIFEQFSGLGQVVAGDAISKTGNTLNVDVDDSTIGVDPSNDWLYIKAGGITDTQISASAAIAQSKLSLLAADADYAAAPGSFTQSDLGLATFDSNQFTVTNGWATVTTIDGGTYT